jgi:anti-sigma regulatory factor (Ser/Thr protein kinase)
LRELSLHLLDIAENSIAAGAKMIIILVEENTEVDKLVLVVEDNGKGMDADLLARVTDPFTTTRTTRKVGLGIPLLKEAAEACNGSLRICSEPGKGTRIEIEFQRSHIDRMPLGDLAETYRTLAISEPAIDWRFVYRMDEYEFEYDQTQVREALGEIPFTDPLVLKFVRTTFEEGLNPALHIRTTQQL